MPDAPTPHPVRELPQPVQRMLRLENGVRNAVRAANYDYRRLERLAMTPIAVWRPGHATCPGGGGHTIPQGFEIRQASRGYPQTRVEIYVPERLIYQRDPFGRILFAKEPQRQRCRNHLRRQRRAAVGARLLDYAFRTITYLRNTGSGQERHEVSGSGWDAPVIIRGSRNAHGPTPNP